MRPTQPTIEPLVYDRFEVAGMLKVSLRTLATLVARNEIPHCRLGDRALRFPREQLLAWLEERTERK